MKPVELQLLVSSFDSAKFEPDSNNVHFRAVTDAMLGRKHDRALDRVQSCLTIESGLNDAYGLVGSFRYRIPYDELKSPLIPHADVRNADIVWMTLYNPGLRRLIRTNFDKNGGELRVEVFAAEGRNIMRPVHDMIEHPFLLGNPVEGVLIKDDGTASELPEQLDRPLSSGCVGEDLSEVRRGLLDLIRASGDKISGMLVGQYPAFFASSTNHVPDLVRPDPDSSRPSTHHPV